MRAIPVACSLRAGPPAHPERPASPSLLLSLLQARLASVSQSLAGVRISSARCTVVRAARPLAAPVQASAGEDAERFRLNNLSPQPGSKKARKRKGRGYGAGQVSGLADTGQCLPGGMWEAQEWWLLPRRLGRRPPHRHALPC